MTPTMEPTLSQVERENLLRELLYSNGGCNLPCWWGMIPGKTAWSEAEQIFHSLGARIGSSPMTDRPGATFHSASVDLEGEPLFEVLGFTEQVGKIEHIVVKGHSYYKPKGFQSMWDHYAPDRILSEYGIPSRVLLSATGVTGIGDRGITGYMLWIVYDHLGFMVRYDGEVEDLPVYHICPTVNEPGSLITIITLDMQSPDDPHSLEEGDGILADERYKDRVKTIEEASGISLQDFHSLLTQEDQPACFNTPHNIWPKR